MVTELIPRRPWPNGDPVADRPDRHWLQERMNRALTSSGQSGNFAAVILLDLDHFKALNEARGRSVGDALLILIAQRLDAYRRGDDIVARLYGDAFVLLIGDLSPDRPEAVALARFWGESIRAAIALPYDVEGQICQCTVSVGITLCRGEDESVETLLIHADVAMGEAKRNGRDTVRFFEPALQRALETTSAVGGDLRRAVDRGQLCLHYQPQLDRHGQVTGVEALLRWLHPQHGLVQPDDFLPAADENGLIVPIGQWVLETACRQIRTWADQPQTASLRVAVNINARQFCEPAFAPRMEQTLAKSGADPTRLTIELSESVVTDGRPATLDRMQAIAAFGVGLVMDDLGGTIAASPSIRRLPLDQVKIDRSRVRGVTRNPVDAAYARSVITLGKTLGVDVIAEGVETREQTAQLQEWGCAAYQGYLFARPPPVPDLEAYLHQGSAGAHGIVEKLYTGHPVKIQKSL